MKQEYSNHRGITLIALIITVIVMLILVGVTLNLTLNGGLIGKANEAKTKTEEAQKTEGEILTGGIKVGDTLYNSLDEYLNSSSTTDEEDEKPKSITLDKKAVTLGQGEKATIVATLENSDEVVQWESGNTSFATVTPIDNNSAEINYVGDGFCVVNAKTSFGSARCEVYCGDTEISFRSVVRTTGKLTTRVQFQGSARDCERRWETIDWCLC